MTTNTQHHCRKCDIELTEKNSWPSQWEHHIYICRPCDKEQHQQARAKKPEQYRERQQQRRQQNPEQRRQSDAAYRERNKEKLREDGKRYYRENIERVTKVRLEWCLALKQEVMAAYSSGTPKCAMCSYSDIRALSIDHINGKGSAHRRELKGGGVRMYQWLKAQGYPDGYQVLCMNCQFIKKLENKESKRQYTATHLPDILL